VGEHLTDLAGKRQAPLGSLPPDMQFPVNPAYIADLDRGDLAGTETEPAEEEQDREVTATGRCLAIAALQKTANLIVADRFWETGKAVPGHRRQGSGEIAALTANVQIPEERPKCGDRKFRLPDARIARHLEKKLGGHRRGQPREIKVMVGALRLGKAGEEPTTDAEVRRNRLDSDSPLLEKVGLVLAEQSPARRTVCGQWSRWGNDSCGPEIDQDRLQSPPSEPPCGSTAAPVRQERIDPGSGEGRRGDSLCLEPAAEMGSQDQQVLGRRRRIASLQKVL
jgi:hypothetical protein